MAKTLQDKGTVDAAARLGVRLGRLALANPVMPASGCFGPELAPLVPLHRLGAVVTKTVFSAVRSGNPAHRLAEVPTGMLNAVGIPSPGIDGFRSRVLPAYRSTGAPVIVSIGGLAVGDYLDVAESLAQERLAAFEINVSCPNLEHGGLEIGSDPRAVEEVTRGVRERAPGIPVITKLTPNVSSVPELARAAEAGGADAVTVANTFVGLSIDLSTRAPVLGNTTGGLSGPAVKPLVLRLVHQVSRAVRIPVVGCGGVRTADDVAEYLIAGASAVQVGTATFTRPSTMTEIVDDLPTVLDRLHADRATDLVSTLALPRPDHRRERPGSQPAPEEKR